MNNHQPDIQRLVDALSEVVGLLAECIPAVANSQERIARHNRIVTEARALLDEFQQGASPCHTPKE